MNTGAFTLPVCFRYGKRIRQRGGGAEVLTIFHGTDETLHAGWVQSLFFGRLEIRQPVPTLAANEKPASALEGVRRVFP